MISQEELITLLYNKVKDKDVLDDDTQYKVDTIARSMLWDCKDHAASFGLAAFLPVYGYLLFQKLDVSMEARKEIHQIFKETLDEAFEACEKERQ